MIMRVLRLFALAGLLAAAAVPRVAALAQARPPASPSDGTVARVNGRPITRQDFDLAVQMQFQGRRAGTISLEELRATREKVIENLIDGELLYQEAVKAKVSPGDAEVQAELDRLKGTFDSPEALAGLLEGSGVSAKEFRDQVARNLAVSRFVDQTIVKDAKVDDAEIRRFYDEHPAEMKRPEGVRISQIVVRVAPGASPAARAEARRKIEEILQQLKAGKEIAEMARLYSDGPGAEKGGDSGWVNRGGGALPPVENAAFALQPGQMSDILETRRGFHILLATARRPEGAIPFEEARESIRGRLQALKREAQVQKYVLGLKETSRIERALPGPS